MKTVLVLFLCTVGCNCCDQAKEASNCSITVNDRDWTVMASCDVTNVVAEDKCIWTVPKQLETQKGTLSRHGLTNEGGSYSNGNCVGSGLSMPHVNGTYYYNLTMSPDNCVWKGPSLEIKQPGNPTLFNCPDYITEGGDGNCRCLASSSNPPAVTSWQGINYNNSLQLRNVSKSEDGTNYTCTQYWAGFHFQKHIYYTLHVKSAASTASETTTKTTPIANSTRTHTNGTNTTPSITITRAPITESTTTPIVNTSSAPGAQNANISTNGTPITPTIKRTSSQPTGNGSNSSTPPSMTGVPTTSSTATPSAKSTNTPKTSSTKTTPSTTAILKKNSPTTPSPKTTNTLTTSNATTISTSSSTSISNTESTSASTGMQSTTPQTTSISTKQTTPSIATPSSVSVITANIQSTPPPATDTSSNTLTPPRTTPTPTINSTSEISSESYTLSTTTESTHITLTYSSTANSITESASAATGMTDTTSATTDISTTQTTRNINTPTRFSVTTSIIGSSITLNSSSFTKRTAFSTTASDKHESKTSPTHNSSMPPSTDATVENNNDDDENGGLPLIAGGVGGGLVVIVIVVIVIVVVVVKRRRESSKGDKNAFVKDDDFEMVSNCFYESSNVMHYAAPACRQTIGQSPTPLDTDITKADEKESKSSLAQPHIPDVYGVVNKPRGPTATDKA